MSWFSRNTGPLPTVGQMIPPWINQGSPTSAIPVNRSSLLGITTAQACIQIISDQIATLPVRVIDDDGETIETPLVIAEPGGPFLGRAEFLQPLMSSLLIDGNAYALMVTAPPFEVVSSIILLNPDSVSVQLVEGEVRYAVGTSVFGPEELLHIRGFTLAGHYRGLGPLSYARATLGRVLDADDYASGTFTGASIPDGVIEAPSELSQETATDLKTKFVAGNGGRQRGPAVLSGGVTYKPLSFKSADLELLDSRQYGRLEICSMFQVPPHLVGVPSEDSKTYSSVTQDSLAFVRFTLRPWVEKLQASLSSLLPPGQYVRFDTDVLLREPYAVRMVAHAAAIAAGILTVNEVREIEGLAPLAPDDLPSPIPMRDPDDDPEDFENED